MIFFDIDGTLFDQEKAEKLAAIRFFKENVADLQLNEAEFIALREIYHHDLLLYVKKGLPTQNRNRLLMRDLFGYHISDNVADQKIADFITIYRQYWIPFDDVIPCLQQLKSKCLHLGIICDGNYDRQIDKLNQLGIKQYFDILTICNQTNVAKPHKQIFMNACNDAGIKPEQAYYIGDNLVYDAIASKNAGMHGIWINRKNRTKYTSVNVIHNLNELIHIIDPIQQKTQNHVF